MDALQHLVDFVKRRKPDEDPVAYLYRLVEDALDPSERVDFYVESSEHFWREGLELVEKGELRQGSEKIWNSVVQLVKAVAERKGLKHHTHRLVWAAVRKIAMEHDPEIITLFAAVEQLHINFYEGHLDKWDVEKLTEAAAKLRKALFSILNANKAGHTQ